MTLQDYKIAHGNKLGVLTIYQQGALGHPMCWTQTDRKQIKSPRRLLHMLYTYCFILIFRFIFGLIVCVKENIWIDCPLPEPQVESWHTIIKFFTYSKNKLDVLVHYFGSYN